MAYSSALDVRNALTPEGASTDGSTAATLSDTQITDSIAEADGLIDAYVGSRYAIVLDTTLTPNVAKGVIRWWSRTIAAYLATLTYKRNQDVPADEPIRLRYDMVMELLEKVRNGTLDLNLVPVDNDSTDVFVENLYEGDLFTPAMFGLDPRFPNRWPRDLWPGYWGHT